MQYNYLSLIVLKKIISLNKKKKFFQNYYMVNFVINKLSISNIPKKDCVISDNYVWLKKFYIKGNIKSRQILNWLYLTNELNISSSIN